MQQANTSSNKSDGQAYESHTAQWPPAHNRSPHQESLPYPGQGSRICPAKRHQIGSFARCNSQVILNRRGRLWSPPASHLTTQHAPLPQLHHITASTLHVHLCQLPARTQAPSIHQWFLPGSTELAMLVKEPSLLARPTLPPPMPAKWWLLRPERSLLPSKLMKPLWTLLVKLPPARLGA